jgi:hypothetical protein
MTFSLQWNRRNGNVNDALFMSYHFQTGSFHYYKKEKFFAKYLDHIVWLLVFFIWFVRLFGTAATPGLLCQPRVIVKVIVEKQMERRLAGETEVLGENLPQGHFCPSQNPT